MRTKIFRSDSVPRALQEIRSELGPRAVIVNTRKIRKRGLWGLAPSLTYEITAAVDSASPEETPSTPARPVAPVVTVGSPKSGPDEDSLEEESGTPSQVEAHLQRLSREMVDLKRLVLASREDRQTEPPEILKSDLYRHAFQRLIHTGLERRLVTSLLNDIQTGRTVVSGASDLIEAFVRRLETLVEVSPIDPESVVRGVVLVGPTGVGKTTTLAKLAARTALQEQRDVQLVTLDTYRIAGTDQLRVYGELIGVPVHVLKRASELRSLVDNTDPATLLLVDTAGRSHREVEALSELASGIRDLADLETHLVLSATTNARDLEEMIFQFDLFHPEKLLFTKLDETSSPGTMISQLIRFGKPLSYLTNGQKVPHDLVLPTSQMVARCLLQETPFLRN